MREVVVDELVRGTFVQAEGKSRQTMFEHGEALYGNKSVDESCR